MTDKQLEEYIRLKIQEVTKEMGEIFIKYNFTFDDINKITALMTKTSEIETCELINEYEESCLMTFYECSVCGYGENQSDAKYCSKCGREVVYE